jgi:hypothetical protein
MKKIKIILCILVASISFTSCSDAIDITQDGELTEDIAIRNVTDLRGFLTGNVYGSLDISSELQLGSVFTDETGIAPGNSGWYFTEFTNILTTDNGYVSGTWITQYATINRVNRLLKLAQNFTPPPADVVAYNSVIAEARAVRALAYLELEAYFSTDMSNNSALGVMKLIDVPSIDSPVLPRVTNGEIYSLIESDLNFAEANLVTNTNYKYVTKSLIYAIRARMYTYRKMYTQAQTNAQWVVDNSGLILTPTTTYASIWNDGIQGEVIFAISRPSSGSWGDIARFWTTNTTNISGAPLLKMGGNLYTAIAGTGDIRKTVFVDATSTTATKIIDKYPGKGNTPLRNDIKVFRLSEMYLILAEAAADANVLTGANSASFYVQKVKQARTTGTVPLPIYTTKAAAMKGVLGERRAELCFEGHRYLDLKRLGTIAGVTNDRNATDDTANLSAPLNLSTTDHRFTFPIPSSEINANPTIQQNPGYN